MSANNNCNFLGRLTKDPIVTTVNAGGNSFNKANFSIAVDKKLSANERQRKKNGEDVKSAYFINMEASGKLADVIAQYFSKGSPIAIRGYYDEYSYTDSTSGDKRYGHKFIVEDFNFVPSDNSQGGGGNSGNYQQNQNVSRIIDNNQYSVSPDDMPF